MTFGVLLLAACLAAGSLGAKTLHFASAFDPQSLDPHALAAAAAKELTVNPAGLSRWIGGSP